MADSKPIDKNKLRQYKSSVILNVIMFMLTLGIYSFFWQRRKINFINALGTDKEFTYSKWTNLTFQTCGVYHFWYETSMGIEIENLKRLQGLQPTIGLPIPLMWILCIFSLGLIPDAMHQRSINKIIDNIDN